MASTQGIRAGRAFVELFADDSKLVRGLRRAEKKLKAFGDSIRNFGLKLAGLGTAMLTPMLGAAKAFSSMGDQVAKMAKRTGLSVEALSELRFVASQTGTEFESLEMGFRPMQRRVGRAGNRILIKECGHGRKAAASTPRGWGFRRPLRGLRRGIRGPLDSRQ